MATATSWYRLLRDNRMIRTNWWFVGHPIDVIYDYQKIGIWQEGDPYLNILEGAAGKPGMIKVLYTGDYNGDGTPTRLINSY